MSKFDENALCVYVCVYDKYKLPLKLWNIKVDK